MKKFILLLAAALCLLPVTAYAEEPMPELSAEAYILYEPESGTVLAEHDADERHLIASTTKIMTALVVLEHCELLESVEIAPEWAGIEGSSMYLKAGQRYTVEELLYGMMLVSGNDAATALACHAAGSVEVFAAWMNEKAAELGCENTHFENACGLDGETHYSTARDLARIAAAAIRNEDFCRIVSTKCKTVQGNTLYNHNKLLGRCEGVFGVKTGYTMAAGRTLVSACERDGMTLICVTLADRNDWTDHASLYDWAYDAWRSVDAADYAQNLSVYVIGGERAALTTAGNCRVLLRKDAELSVTTELPPFIFEGLEQGTELGRLCFWADGEPVGECPLVLENSLPVSDEPLSRGERLLRLWRSAGRNIYSF